MAESILMLIALIVVIVGYYYYYKSIISGNIEFRPLSWVMWSIISGYTLVNMLFTQVSQMELIGGIALFTGPFIISMTILLGMKSSGKRMIFYKSDVICIILASFFSMFLVFLGTNGNYEIQMLFLTIGIDLIVATPLLIEIYKNPHIQKTKPWILWSIGTGCNLIAITDYTIVGTTFLVYSLVATSLIAIYIEYNKTKKIVKAR